MKPLTILGINGSLRVNSSSNVIMDEVSKILPSGIAFNLFKNMENIPAFDDRETDPPTVVEFKKQVQQSDGVLICTPEYAFGVPGALKNAIDWTVGTGEFDNKPVALITASSQGEKGHLAMLKILTAISARHHEDTNLLVSFVRAKVSNGKISDAETKRKLERLVNSFVNGIDKN